MTGTKGMPSRDTVLAIVSVVVWLLAATSARVLGIWPAMGGAAMALGLAIFILLRPAALGWLRPRLLLVLWGAAVGGFMAAATYPLYALSIRTLPVLATDTRLLYLAFRAPPLIVASALIVPVILGEELVWRGLVQANLTRRLGRLKGVFATAAVYSLAHAPIGSAVLVAIAFCCGITWGALSAWTESLVPSLVAHLVWDALVLIWLPLA